MGQRKVCYWENKLRNFLFFSLSFFFFLASSTSVFFLFFSICLSLFPSKALIYINLLERTHSLPLLLLVLVRSFSIRLRRQPMFDHLQIGEYTRGRRTRDSRSRWARPTLILPSLLFFTISPCSRTSFSTSVKKFAALFCLSLSLHR